jgi:hypothetical protein
VSELSHSRADLLCAEGIHAFVGGRCRDCGEVRIQGSTPARPLRKVRKFLVQFEGDERTRWLASDEDIRRTLEALAKTTASSISGGTIPATYVSIEP